MKVVLRLEVVETEGEYPGYNTTVDFQSIAAPGEKLSSDQLKTMIKAARSAMSALLTACEQGIQND